MTLPIPKKIDQNISDVLQKDPNSWVENDDKKIKKRTTSININEDIYKFVKLICIDKNFTFSDFVQKAVIFYLENQSKENNWNVEENIKVKYFKTKK